MLRRHAIQALLLVGCGAPAVQESTARPPVAHSSTATRPSPFSREGNQQTSHDTVGITTRAAIEESHPTWRTVERAPSEAASRALLDVPQGAEVDVFLGTWCGDSRLQITRLFMAIELAGGAGALPFSLRFIGVDRAKHALDETTNIDLTQGRDVRFVPTVIVSRGGTEVGRIVEHPTRSIEEDLHDLLTSARQGFISLTRTP